MFKNIVVISLIFIANLFSQTIDTLKFSFITDDGKIIIEDLPKGNDTVYINSIDTVYICQIDTIYSVGDMSNLGHLILDTTKVVYFNNSMTVQEIQDSIDAQPKLLRSSLYFCFNDGTYNLSDILVFEGFSSLSMGATLFITGNQSESIVPHTNQAVILNFTGGDHWNLYVHSNNCYVNIRNLKVVWDNTVGYYGIQVAFTKFVDVEGCYIKATNNSTKGFCIASKLGTDMRAMNNYVEGSYGGLMSEWGSTLHSDNNLSTGSYPAWGLYATYGGLITKDITNQPSGNNGLQYSQRGGEIR